MNKKPPLGESLIPTTNRKLKVFLCHASQDKTVIRELNQQLADEGWIAPWLDEEKLLPGQDWDIEIEKAVEVADAVIVCLSNNSVNKEGYVQKELRAVINVALEKPPEMIFIIPLRLDECSIPRSIKHIHYFDYFPSDRVAAAYRRLLGSLEVRAHLLGIDIEEIKEHFQKEAEEKARRELVERIRKEEREKARREEEKILRQEAQEHARTEITEDVRKLVEEGKRQEAEEKAKREDELIQKKADELFKREMELLKRKRAQEETEQRRNRELEELGQIDYSSNAIDEQRKTNANMTIVIVIVILICCCTAACITWYYGDAIMLGLTSN